MKQISNPRKAIRIELITGYPGASEKAACVASFQFSGKERGADGPTNPFMRNVSKKQRHAFSEQRINNREYYEVCAELAGDRTKRYLLKRIIKIQYGKG